MKAIAFTQPGPATVLRDVTLEKPTPGPRDLLVSVRAVSVNPVDFKVRSSATPPAGQPRIIGYDAAGVVEAVGPEVRLFRPGDAVFYAGQIDRPGSNAEFQAVDERIVGPMPRNLSFAQAAALPLTAITAWELLFDRLRVPYGSYSQPGVLLVLGAAGGVGSILIQLARRLTGLTVIATASRPETADWVRKMGAHHVVDHRGDLVAAVQALGLGPVTHVAGLTATGAHMPAIAELIAPQGHLSLIDDYDSFDIAPLKRKSVTVAWELMFTRSLFQTADMAAQHRLLSEVSALLDAGVLQTTLTQESGPINAANLAQVHEHLESGKAIGKSVLVGF
ncbi:zinc-binding alcohol dehydrogenase family protein [Roseomonas aerophila]|uniref:Zinc-type alcohol dehydrogenase-like protein n=1 Tax=Teichococcus aerophilus TaxID=1224513 RepID=A0ABR7RT38_9PROT|nr:zinc-binding alcohol dehydrogenase family protein [Pseudoroseomonas aerophila]MBC9209366.1 zinc-binding alcohol dehydrogenase family protein [Pseudoroseomonas aerophila]